MIDPLHALLIAALLLLAAGFVLWPDRGYFWRWQQFSKLGERVLLEDALKHLYKWEYRRDNVSVESLSGALEITGNKAARLLVQLEKLRLLESTGGALQLTVEGRDYALRIIRVHRLWEHYLAEETGLTEADWHGAAEAREHHLSPDEVDYLDERLGHPAYDPHGDPIPTASGDIVPRRGQPLTTLPVRKLATVMHIEDEPADVYAQLVAESLHLGTRVEVIEVTPERIRFVADGDIHILAPLVAANIFVAPLLEEQRMEGPYESLELLQPQEKGKVVRLSPACRGLERRRLMDLGIVPGTVIEAEMRSPSGDPTAYRIRGAMIALRREQARQIYIERQMETAQ